MRVVFVGASNAVIMTARDLIDRGDEIVIIERDRGLIDSLLDELDCSFLHGDGSSPEVLREADPKTANVLCCLTDSDQVNIIASLVGRSLGFRRIVTSIENPDYEHICLELGLEETIIPVRTVSRFLADMLTGIDYMELRTVVKDEARLFSFVAEDDAKGPVSDLDLPGDARVVWFYRGGRFTLADQASQLRKGDEIVVATHSKNLQALGERWLPNSSGKKMPDQ